ncbi:MAG: DUF2066 domain-containing protein [Gammaproteobacteria bacterium]
MDISYPELTRLLVIGAILCLLSVSGSASAMDNLFEADVPVAGQQPDLRSAYMKTALQEVLVRVTGQPDVLRRDSVRAMLDSPEQFVQQYRYYTVPESTPPRLMLRVNFDGGSIQQALRQQGVAYWGKTERPEILLWLAVEDSGTRYIVSAHDNSDAARELQAAARQRGIPLLLPLMDLEDQSRVRFTDVWGGFFDGLLAASARYKPGDVMIGRLNRDTSGGWEARWNMRDGRDSGSWRGNGDRLGDVLRAGIDTLSERLASGLAVAEAGPVTGMTSITVEDVNTLAAFARVDDYLSSLTTVRRLALERVDGSTLQYALQLAGSLDGLTQSIAIGTVLEPSPGGAPGAYRMRQ